MSTLSPEQIPSKPTTREAMAKILHDSAAIQAEASPLFVVYPANTENPELDFLKVSYRGVKSSRVRGFPGRSTPDDLDFFAGMIENRYFGAPEALRGHEAIADMGELIRGGNHVSIGDTHSELFDVPANLVNVSGRLREDGVVHRSALVASKGIDYLGVSVEAMGGPDADIPAWMLKQGVKMLSDGTIPVREVLKLIADRTYFTFPVSRSFEKLLEDHPDAITVRQRFNGLSRAAISTSMTIGRHMYPQRNRPAPLLLALGLSGTKIKELDTETMKERLALPEDRRPEYIIMPPEIDLERTARVIGKLSSATVKMIKGSYLFPTATNLNAEPPTINIGEKLYMDGENDVLDVGVALIKLEEMLHPGMQTIYDVENKLPINR